MRKSTIILLMALALALILPAVQHTAVATPSLRRSRFLANVVSYPPPPPSFYDYCSKHKDCLSPGATTCCQGACVDTNNSFKHCGACNNTCDSAKTCCKGNCVDTFTDSKNCGRCGNKCRTKCTNGYCDYAA